MRWILALDEVARFGRAATWEEWNKVWFRGERYTDAAAKKALTRLCRDLRELGVALHCSEGDFVDGRSHRLRALIEPWLECARGLDDDTEARRRRKRGLPDQEPEDDLGESVVVDPEWIVAEYRDKAKSINEIARLHRIGNDRVARILHARGVLRGRGDRYSLEWTRPDWLRAKALEAFDEGATGTEVARILGCGTGTAWRFLRRNDRQRERGVRSARSAPTSVYKRFRGSDPAK